MKIINLLGFSGSGKTTFIIRAIQLLQTHLNYNIACIKNVRQHKIDIEGKDSFEFTKAGAKYSIIKNQFNEHAFFIKSELEIQAIIEWIKKGPLEVDLIFIEGFRNLDYPTVLCVKDSKEIEQQLSDKVKMISGILSSKDQTLKEYNGIPLRDLNTDFNDFLKIFEISKHLI
jgi:molybdopterin-guanine dinucleotide biosynthesis protein MobB